jgi:esterase
MSIPNAMPHATSCRFTTSNGLTIHYLDWGNSQAQPMVLLHGIARTAHSFDHWALHLSDRYHLIAVDMRGHGESDWDPQGRYMVDDYYSDLAELIAHLHLKQIIVVGNSTGGRVAQLLAARHPDRVQAALIEDVGPERPQAVSDRRAKRMSDEELGWAHSDLLLARLKNTYPRISDERLGAIITHGTRRDAEGRLFWRRDPAILGGFVATDLWQTISQIRTPILYVLGGASDIVAPETQERLRRELPKVQIITMPGLGHYPSDESTAAFMAIMDTFLSALPHAR